jgi:hypothetical protein
VEGGAEPRAPTGWRNDVFLGIKTGLPPLASERN